MTFTKNVSELIDSAIENVEKLAAESAKYNAGPDHVLYCQGVSLSDAYPELDQVDLSEVNPCFYCSPKQNQDSEDKKFFRELLEECMSEAGLNPKCSDADILDKVTRAFIVGWYAGCQSIGEDNS